MLRGWLPDVTDGVADLDRKVHFGTCKAFRRIFKGEFAAERIFFRHFLDQFGAKDGQFLALFTIHAENNITLKRGR